MTYQSAHHTIKIDWHDEITISDEMFAQIQALLCSGKVCKRCKRGYSDMNPEVQHNRCLTCFKQQENHKYNLQYLGEAFRDTETGYVTHKWMDPQGYIRLSQTNSDKEPSIHAYWTLKHYGFQPPQGYAGKQISLYADYWSICGDFQQNSKVVVHYKRDHDEQFYFLLGKDGSCKPFSKQMKLYRDARKQYLASRNRQGYYCYDGDPVSHVISEYYILQIASDLASA